MRRDRRRHCIEAKNALFKHKHSMMKGTYALHLFGRNKSTRADKEGWTGRCDDGHDWDNVL